MTEPFPAPVIEVIAPSQGGGYRICLDNGNESKSQVIGEGQSLDAALQALSAETASHYVTEKGDETAATEDARRQADILANDRSIRGGQMQQTVMIAAALGVI